MKPPCAKFSTSINPNTKVSPDAIRNSIMPIASPATVSASQLDPDMNGITASITAGSRK